MLWPSIAARVSERAKISRFIFRERIPCTSEYEHDKCSAAMAVVSASDPFCKMLENEQLKCHSRRENALKCWEDVCQAMQIKVHTVKIGRMKQEQNAARAKARDADVVGLSTRVLNGIASADFASVCSVV